MLIHATKPLFAWDELQTSPTLGTMRQAREAVPDGPLLAALQRRRHNGCDKYPVRVLWGALLLSILLRHPTTEACLEELRRNAPLRLPVGIESEAAVPNGWNLTRFLAVLGQPDHLALLRDVFDHLVRRVGAAVPDPGRHTAGDSAGLRGRRDPGDANRRAEVAAGRPQAGGGRKEYRDADGAVTEVVEWFGYKPHLLVDARHEVVLAFDVTDPSAGDNERVEALVEQAEANLSARPLETLAYDKAADDGKVHERLRDHGIKPVIEVRNCWPKGGDREKVIGGRVRPHVVHDAAGAVYCYDTTGPVPVRRAMSYAGHEADRGTLKYRCPAKVGGFPCGREAACNAGKSYGLTVRVPQGIDLRRSPAVPRATPQFERLYQGRTGVERGNDRLKVYRGLDDGNVAGARRSCAHVSAVLIAHLSCATLLAKAQRTEGSFGTMRLSPIAKKLADLVAQDHESAPIT